MEKQALIEKLFSVGAHFGYAPSRRHPSRSRLLFLAPRVRPSLSTLSTHPSSLLQALEFVKTLSGARKTVLFVGSKAEAREALTRAAERLNQPYVASRWIGGTLTNFSEIKKRVARLTDATSMREKGELAKFTKHERLLIDREITDLELMFGGLKGMNKLPDALVIVDPRQEMGAVKEAQLLNIPVVAILNTDCDKKGISYPIPANDASVQSVSFILGEIASTYEQHLGLQPKGGRQRGRARRSCG
jgi:small subunit ribosomal protein S2